MNLQEKVELFKTKNYVQMFDEKARGFHRNLDVLMEQREFCTLNHEESMELKKDFLSQTNAFPKKDNVLYIHIPFCVSRCNYCAYYISAYNKDLIDQYVDALLMEMEYISNTQYAKSTEFQGLYFGGGTPSALNEKNIKRVLDKVFSLYNFSKEGQFTFESNAATLTESKIKLLKECGINRVSLGVQTFDDALLKDMNCAHNSEMVLRVVKFLKQYGLITNMDLIFGLIGQTEELLKRDLDMIAELKDVEHLSYFPLRLVERSNMEDILYSGGFDEEQMSKLVRWDGLIERELNKQGYEREFGSAQYHKRDQPEHLYISTSSRVLALGVGAGTLVDYGEFFNHDDIQQYIASVNRGEAGLMAGAPFSEEQKYERFIVNSIIYGNRSIDNFKDVVANNFKQYYETEIGDRYQKVLDDMMKRRFIKMDGEKIILTKRMEHVLSQVRVGIPSVV